MKKKRSQEARQPLELSEYTLLIEISDDEKRRKIERWNEICRLLQSSSQTVTLSENQSIYRSREMQQYPYYRARGEEDNDYRYNYGRYVLTPYHQASAPYSQYHRGQSGRKRHYGYDHWRSDHRWIRRGEPQRDHSRSHNEDAEVMETEATEEIVEDDAVEELIPDTITDNITLPPGIDI